ncbi:hypothetical protein HAP47_0007345 [Bradyrhizobium sp. 41S5]|uniref:DUF6925 family protein n=1 Tax=Bradyrhizobium sp. 41S5 TaxID=1404443 RepID=UPI00156B175D|nr:hypothetical protein [Bradyrhizobium sp. 41S5]UFX46490.1 hypothetical protein HAP47_0007345 [Bradyrhizobium sp. 41S5]
MTAIDPVKLLIIEQLQNPTTQWSVGTFGGIAEFSRDVDETGNLTIAGEAVRVFTARGGIEIKLRGGIRPFASESITKDSWSHRVSLCLREADCVMNRRTTLTELGTDKDALRVDDRRGVLFDLGLKALQADLCIRVADLKAVERLREYTGRPLFEVGNPAISVIFSINPHRVFISRIGRVEVYQPIPAETEKSPDGPHTHVLPKLLKSRRTHPATEPVPEGWIPCAHLYPAHPAKDAFGTAIPFAIAHHEAFQKLHRKWGSPEVHNLKKRVLAAIEEDLGPQSIATPRSREGRTAIRVSLRQLKSQGHKGLSLARWLQTHDRAEPREDDEHGERYHQTH